MRKPSPGLLVATLALFVAMFGTAYAGSKINGADLKNRSVEGNKLANNTLKGKQIKESSLNGVEAGNVLWVSVDAGCTKTSGSEGSTVTQVQFTNNCSIQFPINTDDCAATATLTGGSFMKSIRLAKNSGQIQVSMLEADGSGTLQAALNDFDVVAVC